MPDAPAPTVTPTPSPAAPAAGDAAQLIAGKYKDEAAFSKGYVELLKVSGIKVPDNFRVLGEGGRFSGLAPAVEAYKALESLRGSQAQDGGGDGPAPAAEGETPKPGAKGPAAPDLALGGQPPGEAREPESLEALVASTGLKMDDLEKQWSENGELTPEQYAAFRKRNPAYGRVAVDGLAQGIVAKKMLQARIKAEQYAIVDQQLGGRDKHDALRAWARDNVEPARLARLDKQVEADPGFYPDMMGIIEAAWRRAGGHEGSTSLIAGGQGAADPGGAFGSDDEVRHAMSDKRYAPTLPGGFPNPDHVPAYRQKVLARLQATAARASNG